MIPFASQRGGGQDLATHLQNAYDNEMVDIAQLRGSIAHDLHGAFKEWEVQAHTLTKCQKYLYSMSINPDPEQEPLTRDQYMDYIGRAEAALGLGEQPRAVVYHIKNGREHCHVIWSRIDAQHEKAVHLAFDHDKLMRVTRDFARNHGLTLPAGYEKSRQVRQESLYEWAQQQATGLSKEDHSRVVTEAWHQRDDATSFVQSLAERGYLMATGRRDYVLVDLYGGMHALPRLIADKAVRTKGIREFLGKDFPVESLPSVEDAQKLVFDHRQTIERSGREDRAGDQLAELKQAQAERRRSIEQEQEALIHNHAHLRACQHAQHRVERNDLRDKYLSTMKSLRHERNSRRPNGLAVFLGKVTGVSLVQRKFERYQDGQHLKTHREQKKNLEVRQKNGQNALSLRISLQEKELERRTKALEKIDKRELAALLRDIRRDSRIRARGDDEMPSLVRTEGRAKYKPSREAPDLLATFERARKENHSTAPDLSAAFERAASERTKAQGEGDTGTAIDQTRRPSLPDRSRRPKDRDRPR